MKIKLISRSLFALCLIFILTNCAQKDSCSDEVLETETNVVYYYNAYFDFFHIIESFDFEKLRSENILTDKGVIGEIAVNYELNFPDGYVDEKGNSLSGTIIYASNNQIENATGNEITFEFDDLTFNGIGVDGLKVMTFASAAELDWCGGISGVVFSYEAATTVFAGCLSKSISEDEIVVTGSNTLEINDSKYVMEIVEPIQDKANCDWFTSGKVNIKERNTRVLGFEKGCAGIEMKLSNESGCHSIQLNQIHNLW